MSFNKKLLIVFCLLVNGVVYAQKPDPKFHLYILMGQSNMAGRGPLTEEFRKDSNLHVLMLNKDLKWVIAKHPVHFDKPSVAGVGPGLSFGIKMAEADPKIKIGLIPCAVGGTPIEHWIPGAYDAATKTHPWDDAMIRIQEAMKYGVIKGVIWHQGESNSGPKKINEYLVKLVDVISRVRDLTDNPKLPFVAGELGRYRAAYANINEQLALLPKLVNNTAVVSSEGLVHKGDTTHFDGKSATELGKRYAAQMLLLQKK